MASKEGLVLDDADQPPIISNAGQNQLIKRRARKIAFGSTVEDRIAEFKKIVSVTQSELDRVIESANEEFSLTSRVRELLRDEIKNLLRYLKYNNSADRVIIRRALKSHRKECLALERLQVQDAVLAVEEWYHFKKRVVNQVRHYREKRLKHLQSVQFHVVYEAEKVLHPGNEQEIKVVLDYHSKICRARNTLMTSQRLNSKFRSMLAELKSDSLQQPNRLQMIEDTLMSHRKELYQVHVVFRNAIQAQEEIMRRWKEVEDEVKQNRSWRDGVKQRFITYEVFVKADFEAQEKELAKVPPYHIGIGRKEKEIQAIMELEAKDGEVREKILQFDNYFDTIRNVTHGSNHRVILERMNENMDVELMEREAQRVTDLNDELHKKRMIYRERKAAMDFKVASLKSEQEKEMSELNGKLYEEQKRLADIRTALDFQKKVILEAEVGAISLLLVLLEQKAADEQKTNKNQLLKRIGFRQAPFELASPSKASRSGRGSPQNQLKSTSKPSARTEDHTLDTSMGMELRESPVEGMEHTEELDASGLPSDSSVTMPVWMRVIAAMKICSELIEELKKEVEQNNSSDGKVNDTLVCLDRLDPNEIYYLNEAKLRINLMPNVFSEESAFSSATYNNIPSREEMKVRSQRLIELESKLMRKRKK